MKETYEVMECEAVDCLDKEPHWVVYHETGVGVAVFYTEEEAVAEAERLNKEVTV